MQLSPESRLVSVLLAALFAATSLSGCAQGGDDGIIRRGGDGAVRTLDAAATDASTVTDATIPTDASTLTDASSEACVPTCDAGEHCWEGACVSSASDMDMDGVPVADDCDDGDATVGATAERPCTSDCGAGVEVCTAGTWAACTAPATCECTAGSAPRVIPCGNCGMQSQTCVGGMWTNDGACAGSGACTPGAVEMGAACGNCGRQQRTCDATCGWGGFVCLGEGTCSAGTTQPETRACPGTCGNTETRSRTCSTTTCTWGTFTAWSGCTACGPVCGDSVCASSESCETCADCRYGHLGSGEGGTSCAGVPAETWRCVNSARWGTTVSQFCRSGEWTNYNLTPRDCNACRCSYSSACLQ